MRRRTSWVSTESSCAVNRNAAMQAMDTILAGRCITLVPVLEESRTGPALVPVRRRTRIVEDEWSSAGLRPPGPGTMRELLGRGNPGCLKEELQTCVRGGRCLYCSTKEKRHAGIRG